MKGLLIKDFCLLRGQKKFFLMVIILALVMALVSDNTSFLFTYSSIVIPMFALSTLSYDEYDNGFAFLFTLPTTRTKYVLEKYCFSALLGLCAIVISTLLVLGVELARYSRFAREVAIAAPIMLCAVILLMSLMIPLQLKFGAEKSRIVMISVIAAIAAIAFVTVKIFNHFQINIALLLVSRLPIPAWICIAYALCILLVLLSVKFSVSLLKKKEL